MAGLGTVGQGFAELVQSRSPKELGGRVEIVRVLVRHRRKKRRVALPANLLTTSPQDFLETPADVVVEALGGDQAPRALLLKAMKKKRHIVSSNKVVLAKYAPELLREAERQGVHLRFEASCGAGIPFLHSLHESLAANRIGAIMGIVNGTTNYILTAMEKEEKALPEVLQEAQRLGFAEPNPSDDIDGEDARYKAGLLALLGFGTFVSPKKIYAEGIRSIALPDLKYAGELGFRIKLLTLLGFQEKKLLVRVHPVLLPLDHPLSAIGGVYNAVFIKTDAAGELMFVGKGAGPLPTASALLGDVLQVQRMQNVPVPQPVQAESFLDPGDWQGRYYLRMEVLDRPGVLASIASTLGKFQVSIESVIQKRSLGKRAEIVWLTHSIRERNLQKARGDLQKLSVVKKVNSVLRVL